MARTYSENRRWVKTLTPEERAAHRKQTRAAYRKAHPLQQRTSKTCAKKLEAGRRWQRANPDKVRASNRKQYHADPRKFRGYHLQREYGISVDAYDKLLDEQGGCCAICFRDEPDGKGAFHVDHCHITNRVRGLLCSTCNRGLGMFKDNPRLLRSAIMYLQETR